MAPSCDCESEPCRYAHYLLLVFIFVRCGAAGERSSVSSRVEIDDSSILLFAVSAREMERAEEETANDGSFTPAAINAKRRTTNEQRLSRREDEKES